MREQSAIDDTYINSRRWCDSIIVESFEFILYLMKIYTPKYLWLILYKCLRLLRSQALRDN